MEDNGKKYLKWGICALLVGAVGVVVLPIVAHIVWSLVSIVAGLAVLGAAWFLFPLVAEMLATIVWKGKELIWKSDPVTKLWRDLSDFGREIESLETNIAEVVTNRETLKGELAKQRQYLDAADVMQWQEDIDGLVAAEQDLIADRDSLRNDYRDMERTVRKEEANWKIGKAFGKAADALEKAGKISAGTHGGRVSMDAIQERLANGRARLAVIKSRKPQERKQQAIDITAKVVPETKPQRVSLTNNPSPVLGDVRTRMNVGTGQVEAVGAPVKSHAESLIDKL